MGGVVSVSTVRLGGRTSKGDTRLIFRVTGMRQRGSTVAVISHPHVQELGR